MNHMPILNNEPSSAENKRMFRSFAISDFYPNKVLYSVVQKIRNHNFVDNLNLDASIGI